jgi:hypothetical protein
VEEILQNFRQPDGGLDVPQALAQLVTIFGPGSNAMSIKLLDDLAVDPSGDSRANWDTAIEEAIGALNDLTSDQQGRKGKQKGRYLGLFVIKLYS